MSNASEFREGLMRLSKARIPFVTIKSHEQGRAKRLLTQVAKELGLSFYFHSISEGLRDLSNNSLVSDEKSFVGLVDHISNQFRNAGNQTFVFTDIEGLDADGPTTRLMKDLVRLGEQSGGAVYVMTSDPIWPALGRNGMSIELDPPDVDEMHEIIRSVVDPYRGRVPVEWTDDDFHTAASVLVGITKLEAENILATLIADGHIRSAQLSELSNAKDRIFSDLSGIERVHVKTAGDAVGGLENLHVWLDRKHQFITADLRERDMRPPRGILLVGVPGCGKSLSAKAISARWKLPLYRLDVASIMGQYVGQSESRFREALSTADHVAPCVLWIDEIEKALGAGANDSSGVTTRLIGQFLYWLQESPARVFVVATANDVSKLPPELMRRGRFDELFFVDLPTAKERGEIIKIYLQRYVRGPVSPELAETLTEMSDGFTGADIESAVHEIGEEEIRSGQDGVSDDFMLRVFRNLVPMSQTNPEAIESIREWGRQRALPASEVSTDGRTDINPQRRVLLT